MDGDPTQPLTAEQAKARLRAAAERVSPAAWLQAHPLSTLGLAVAGGVVLSRFRFPVVASTVLLQSLLPVVLRTVIRHVSGKEDSKP